MNDQILNIQFVQEVEKHPCLYNYNLTEYSRRDVTEKAWSEVGKIMNLTESQCKEKWKNLRAVFVRHQKSAPSGSSTKKKPYYLTEVMQFTIPFIRTLSSVSGNLPNIYQEEKKDVELDSSIKDSVPHSPMSLSCIPPTPPTTNLPPSSTSCPPLTPPSQNVDFPIKKGKKSKILTDYDRTVMDYFKAKKAKIAKRDDDTTNTRKMFLLSLLDEVSSMSDIQMRTFKRKVLSLIDDILKEPTQNLPTYTHPTELEYVERSDTTVQKPESVLQDI